MIYSIQLKGSASLLFRTLPICITKTFQDIQECLYQQVIRVSNGWWGVAIETDFEFQL